MRLLHTSDWHLGRTFHGGPLLNEQQRMVDEIVAIAADQRVDAVVIAGDLFDRAIPSVESVELWEQAVARLRATGAIVVAIAGNHDSARRVSVHEGLLARSGVVIRGAVDRCDDPVVITPADGGEPVAIYPVPYLDPVAARSAFGDAAYEGRSERTAPSGDGFALLLGGEEADGQLTLGGFDDPAAVGAVAVPTTPTAVASFDEATDSEGSDDSEAPTRRRVTHRSITRAALDRIRADLVARGRPRSIVVAHAFVTGGESSDSERDITLGNVESVPLDVFDDIDYVALGHLHGPQTFLGGRVVYSGSPLPYSFSEERHNKSVRIVELASDGKPTVESIPIDVGMRLVTLTGSIDELLASDAHPDAVDAYVRVHLTDRHLPMQAMARLRERYPRTVELRHVPEGEPVDATTGGASVALRREAPPVELATAFFRDQEGREPTAEELDLLQRALEAVVGVDV